MAFRFCLWEGVTALKYCFTSSSKKTVVKKKKAFYIMSLAYNCIYLVTTSKSLLWHKQYSLIKLLDVHFCVNPANWDDGES